MAKEEVPGLIKDCKGAGPVPIVFEAPGGSTDGESLKDDAAAAAPTKGANSTGGGAKSVGKRCTVDGVDCEGTIRFVGPHHETGKDRVGVELDEAVGKHSGTVKGNAYFKCAKKCGILVDPKKVSEIEDVEVEEVDDEEVDDDEGSTGVGDAAEDDE